jgi:hypothetical protein
MMKISVTTASVKVRFRKHLGGSLLKGTVFHKWDGVDTHLAIESDAPADKLKHLIRNARNGCYAEGLVVQSVPLNATTEVNGRPFDVKSDAPA